jgi:hypothetical protein
MDRRLKSCTQKGRSSEVCDSASARRVQTSGEKLRAVVYEQHQRHCDSDTSNGTGGVYRELEGVFDVSMGAVFSVWAVRRLYIESRRWDAVSR